MFKVAGLASLFAVCGMILGSSDAKAGHPYCGPSYEAYYGYAPVVVNPYSVGRVGFGTPYIGPDRYGHGFGYGNPGYRSYRAPVSVGVGGYPYGYGISPYGYSNFGAYNSFRGGSGISLYIGR